MRSFEEVLAQIADVDGWMTPGQAGVLYRAAAAVAPGGRIEKAAAVPVGNVMLVCPTCKTPTRIGYKIKDVKGETVKVRVCKRSGCGQEIDK